MIKKQLVPNLAGNITVHISFKYKCMLSVLLMMHSILHAQSEVVCPGVSYEHVVMGDPDQSIHIVRIDPKEVAIIVDAAGKQCIGAEKASDIARRNQAVVAINGSFFDFKAPSNFIKLCLKTLDMLGYSNYSTVPVYALKINGEWLSSCSTYTGMIGWSKDDQRAFLDVGKTKLSCVINGISYPVHELNKPYREGPAIYSHLYGAKTPRRSKSRVEVVVDEGRVQKVLVTSHGKTPIPRNGFVYSCTRNCFAEFPLIQEGDSAVWDVVVEKRDSDPNLTYWSSLDFIIGSTPLLLYEGEVVPTLLERTSSFYTERHPRTAIGITGDGAWVLLVVDGRQKKSAGFTIIQLAEYMQKIGCKEALNFDGGGSSTMVIKDKVVNAPVGHEWSLVKKERPISHALLVVSKL